MKLKFMKEKDIDNPHDCTSIVFATESVILTDVLKDFENFLKACGYFFDGNIEISTNVETEINSDSYSQDAAKIAELEAEVEALILKRNRWREMAEANEDRLRLFEESIRHSFKEREDQLAEKLRIATEALKEASEWNRVDDVNGEAGRIAKQALEKLKSE